MEQLALKSPCDCLEPSQDWLQLLLRTSLRRRNRHLNPLLAHSTTSPRSTTISLEARRILRNRGRSQSSSTSRTVRVHTLLASLGVVLMLQVQLEIGHGLVV